MSQESSSELRNFDLGMEEFSSSGDSVIRAIVIDTDPGPSTSRFQNTTEAERNEILQGSDSSNTKKATKGAVKVFRSRKSLKYISSN